MRIWIPDYAWVFTDNDKSNRLKQQIDQVNDEKLKSDIDLTNLNAELEFLNGFSI